MTIPKKIREQVYKKYNGHCAYCGHEIDYELMQIDHIDPLRRGGETELSNLNPACSLCNHYKRAHKLEWWREFYLKELINRIRQIYIVRVAEKYGMITFHEWNKKFYFEKHEVEE